MKLKNNELELEVNKQCEIEKINFLEESILHNGKAYWKKTYPVLFPVIGFSNGFEVNKKNYQIPKHGFWKDMQWEGAYENNGITMMATHIKNDLYPFSIDIQQNITLDQNQIIINTIFSNIGQESAFFHFGHHPAFKIDENSKLEYGSEQKPQIIDANGKLRKEKFDLKEFMQIPFGKEFDTLSFKDVDFNKVNFRTGNVKIGMDFKGFNSLQLWKPEDADFICIEPWIGWSDNEYNAPAKVEEKIDIIKLESGQIKTFTLKMNFEKILLN